MTMRYICFWQNHSALKRWWIRRGSLWSLLAIWARNVLAWTALCYALWTGYVGPTEKWLMNLPKESETVLHERVCQTFCRIHTHTHTHTHKWLTSCQYRQNCLSNFLLHEKVCQILWACRLKMDTLTLQNNFGWLPRQSDVSINSTVLEVACNALPVYLGIISFWVFEELKTDNYGFP